MLIQINPISSKWKCVGLELRVPMMYHTSFVKYINPTSDGGENVDPN